MRITVAVALPGRQEVIAVEVQPGGTVGDALAAARIAARFPQLEMKGVKTGIWSREAGLSTPLKDGDRVEIYRPLTADPKEKRRSRALRSSTRSRNGP